MNAQTLITKAANNAGFLYYLKPYGLFQEKGVFYCLLSFTAVFTNAVGQPKYALKMHCKLENPCVIGMCKLKARIKVLDTLNLVKISNDGFLKLEPIFATAPAASKMMLDSKVFKSDLKIIILFRLSKSS